MTRVPLAPKHCFLGGDSFCFSSVPSLGPTPLKDVFFLSFSSIVLHLPELSDAVRYQVL